MTALGRLGLICLWACAALLTFPVSCQADATNIPGTVSGAFNVTLSGTASYSVPIKVAPGAGGMAPQLSLVYNSQAPSGALGAGWSISGISVITRGPKTLHSDGRVDAVRLTDDDALYLDGQKLIAVGVTGNGANRQIEYRKEIDDITRVRQYGPDFGSSKFIVNTKAGLTLAFDGSSGSNAVLSDGTVLSKSVSFILDSVGNSIAFSYSGCGVGSVCAAQAAYTGHGAVRAAGNVTIDRAPFAEVKFEYEPAATTTQSYVAGRLVTEAMRLREIISRVANAAGDANASWLQVSRYHLTYLDRFSSANRFVLTKIEQFGSDDTKLHPTTFSYSDPKTGWSAAPFQLPTAVVSLAQESIAAAYRFANTSATPSDQKTLLFAAQIDGTLQAFAFSNDGSGAWTKVDQLAPPAPFVSSDGADLGAVLTDITGTGQDALLQSYNVTGQNSVRHAFLQENGKWTAHDEYSLPFDISNNGQVVGTYLFGKLTGGSGLDLLYQSGSEKGFRINGGMGTGWQQPQGAGNFGPPVDISHFAKLMDIDCDGSGKLSLVSISKEGSDPYKWRIFRFASDGWHEERRDGFIPKISATISPAAIRVVTVPGTSCPGLLVATAEQAATVHTILIPSSTGWSPAAGLDPPFDLVDSSSRDADAIQLAPLAGTEVDFVANQIQPGGSFRRFAFALTSSGWANLGAAFTVPIISSTDPNIRVKPPILSDIDGDGRIDLLFPNGSRRTLGRVFLRTSGGFQEQPDFAPPVVLADSKNSDRGIRFIDLKGDGLPDIIVSRKVAKPGSTEIVRDAYLNTGSGWLRAPGLVPPEGYEFAGDNITGNPVQFVDVDGSGYKAMLYSYKKADGTLVRAFFKNEACVPSDPETLCGPPEARTSRFSRKWVKQDVSDDNFTPPTNLPFAVEGVGDQGVQVVDLNGDGRPDLIAGTLLSRGSSSNAPAQVCQGIGANRSCSLNRAVFQTAAYLNNGHGWTRSAEYAPPVPFISAEGAGGKVYPLFSQLVDVDGDGLPDIVASFQHPYDPSLNVQEVWQNTGNGWRLSSTLQLPKLPNGSPLLLDAPLRDSRVSIQWIDITGGGRPGVVYVRRQGATNQSMTWLSTGQGFVDGGDSWKVPLSAIADVDGDSGFRFADVNGDGYPDIVYSRSTANGGHEAGLYINNGSGWLRADDATVAALPPFVNSTGRDQGARLLDVTGQGVPAVVSTYNNSGTGVALATVVLNRARRSDILQEIDTGYNLKTSIAYQTLLEADPSASVPNAVTTVPWRWVYQPGASPQFPLVASVPATYVVRRTEVDEGNGRRIGFSYRYGGFRVDVSALSPVGFAWRESLNEVSGVLSHTDLSQNVLFSGKEIFEGTCSYSVQTIVSLSKRSAVLGVDEDPPPLCTRDLSASAFNGHNLSTSSMIFSTRTQLIAAMSGFLSHQLSQVATQEMRTVAFELDGNVTSDEKTAFTYDEPQDLLHRRLEVVRTTTNRGDGTSVSTENKYDSDNSENWILNRLTHSVVHKIGDVSGNNQSRFSEDRSVEFGYDQKTGLLAFEIKDSDSDRPTRTDYTRDVFGNVVQTRLSAPRELDRNSRTEFDVLGRYPVKAINALDQATITVRRALDGQAVLTEDLNGSKSKFEYDGFGRLIGTTSPNGVRTTITLSDSSNLAGSASTLGLSVAYGKILQIDMLPPVIELYDNKGRLIRSVGEGFTNDPAMRRPVQRDFAYDLLGRLVATSRPYDRGSLPAMSRRDYDVLGRAIRSETPKGEVTHRLYHGHATQLGGTSATTIDALSHQTTEVTNMRGLPVTLVDAKGGSVRYMYDAGDRLTSMIGPMGQETRHKFNEHGEEIETVDPDIGASRYIYDAFGRVVQQIDAKGQVVSIEYDALGRRIREARADVIHTWVYDIAPHGVGRLAREYSTNGYGEDYGYDSFGRQVWSMVRIDNETFTQSIDLDDLGRISRQYYPDGFVTHNAYDSKGFLVSVSDDQTGALYWSLRSMGAAGQITDEELGNGIRTIRNFDPLTARPIEFNSIVAGHSILDLKLQYDAVGNLLHREEASQHISESFEYDDLDRLTTFRRQSGKVEAYSYDAAGRITFKSGVGEYSYTTPIYTMANGASSNASPFDAVKTTEIGGTKLTYVYDRNGNMTKGPNGAFEYTSDNSLRLLYLDQSRWTRFDYGPEGNRFKEFARLGPSTTVTIFAHGFERVTDYDGRLDGARLGSEVRNRYYISNGDGVFAVVERVRKYANVWLGGIDNQRHEITGRQLFSTQDQQTVRYLHMDQLGSIILTTDADARISSRTWYDPWGKIISGKTAQSGRNLADDWTRGFIGNEHLATFGLIHMNRRVYNPMLGAFTSVDPINQSLTDTQTLNGYSYARDNPLRFVDPSGYGFFGAIGHAIGHVVSGVGNAIGGVVNGATHLINEAGRWLATNWRTVVIVVAVVAVTVATGGVGAGLGAAILSGMAAGATGGALSAALYGGSFDDILAGAIKGGVIGAFSGAAFYGVGSALQAGEINDVEAIAGHGVIGGAREAVDGGNFWRGFASGALTKTSSLVVPDLGDGALNTGRAALVGGTVAAVDGGKFADGAITGAMSYALNDGFHRALSVSAGAAVGARVGAVVASGACDLATDGACVLATPEAAAVGASTGAAVGGAFGWIYGAVVDLVSGSAMSSSGIGLSGEPGSSITITNPDGTPKQTRIYGPDGYPVQDIDYNHDHGQGQPHVHDWTRPADGSPPTSENRQKGRPVDPENKP
jgi:RHS repeat-associated protein